MRHKLVSFGLSLLMAVAVLFGATAPAHAQAKKPNIVVIMGDDVGAWDTRR